MTRLVPLNFDTLGKSGFLKLRKFYKLQNNLPANTSEQNLLNFGFFENKNELYYALTEEYNADKLQQRTERDAVNRTAKNTKSRATYTVRKAKKQKNERESKAKKTISKFLKTKKYNIKPNETAFNLFYKYTIPANVSVPYQISIKIEEDSKPVRMPVELLEDCLHNLNQYIHPIIKDNLKSFKFIRTYDKVQFLCFNTQEGENYGPFLMERTLTRLDSGNIHEISEHRYNEVIRQMEGINDGCDYVYVYGVGEYHIQVMQYNPLTGSSYSPLPKIIADTKSIINIKNNDELCFVWSCIASRHLPQNHAERMTHYEAFKDEFQYNKEDMPMKVNKISKFEKANNVHINVYSLDDDGKTKIPVHISKHPSEEVINLFLYNNHYSLIKTFNRFSGGTHDYTCPRCMKSYANTESFNHHTSLCKDLNENGSSVIMPEENTFTQFNDYSKQKRLPVVMYSDFECSLMDTTGYKKTNKSTMEEETVSKDYISKKHVANSYRIRIVSDVDLQIPLDYEYVGEETDIHFVKQICELERTITFRLRELSKENIKPKLTKAEQLKFLSAKECILCGEELKGDRVRDHCHFTGKYEGACHKKCNVKATQLFKGNIKIPLFFHNANYDKNCFINAFRVLKGDEYIKKIGGVPCNMEIFKSLNINNICIMDSYAHLSSSLSSLIDNLPDEKKVALQTITDDPEKFELINKKGFYPYEFVDSIDKLDTPISELKREHFDSKLYLESTAKGTGLTDDDWEHIQTVITSFNIKTLREWHDLYLKIDVFGLCDVFEYYRELSMKTYGLDPAHYIGLPSLTWNAGLKETKVKLQNITDPDLFMFFEKMKRGGVSVISHRYAKANNEYLPDYDETKETSFIMQVDCNNLYGKSMCGNLPVDGIEWEYNFDMDIIQTYKSTDGVGYILEVDLAYPKALHDSHNDYPLAPEHLIINGQKKLAPNLNDKTNYIVHIDNLQYYLSKGMIITKVHRVVKFNQSDWLKKYIDKNSKLRQLAKNAFEKDFYKLMNNAFYGKTMENVRDRTNVQFCLNEKSFAKHTSSPLFANQINVIQSDGLALVKTHKKTVMLNKPIYIGATILESSKLLMYQFHYDTMKIRYPDSIMMKTDTDSLCYLIQTNDLYEELKEPELQDLIEFSNYPKTHPLYNCDRKKVPGLFQDESVDGKMAIISEYVGLRAKSYSNQLYYPSSEEYIDKKKSKGVPSRHIDKRVDFSDYKTCLFDQKNIKLGDENGKEEHREKIYSFRSFKLTTYSVEQSKIALSFADDKRYIMEDKITTLALGHYRIQELQNV